MNEQTDSCKLSADVVQELNGLIAMLEAQIPSNPKGKRGEKAEKQLEKIMADYFRALEKALPMDELERIYYKNAGQ